MGTNFDLYKPDVVFRQNNVEPDVSKDPNLPTKVEVSSKQQFEFPIISGRNVFVLDFVNQLMDHHIVKRELKAAEQSAFDDEDEGGSIFDDFFGGGSSKPKEEKKSNTVKTIDVDKSMLLGVISDYYSAKGYVLLGLILAYENKDIVLKRSSADNLVKNVIVEVVKGTKADNNDATERVTKAVDDLVKRFNLKNDDYFVFVRNQYRFLENLRLEFRFIKAGRDSSFLLFRLEEELIKSLNFINVMTSYPFAIDLEKDQQSLKSILSLIEYIEDVVECMFIYEHESTEEQLNSFHEESMRLSEEASARPSSNTLSVTNPEGFEEKKVRPKSGKIQVRLTQSIKKPGRKIKNENSQQMAEL